MDWKKARAIVAKAIADCPQDLRRLRIKHYLRILKTPVQRDLGPDTNNVRLCLLKLLFVDYIDRDAWNAAHS